jgi:hypothetical protein
VSEPKLRIRLPDQNPVVFDAFNTYIYTGRLQSATSTAVKSYLQICQIYEFGLRYEIPKLCNMALDAFYGKIVATNAMGSELPYDMITWIYEHTGKRDALRKFIIDVMVFVANRDTLDDLQGKLPVQFFLDLLFAAAGQGIVPFEAEMKCGRHLARLEREICECYHEHGYENSSTEGSVEGEGYRDSDGDEEMDRNEEMPVDEEEIPVGDEETFAEEDEGNGEGRS